MKTITYTASSELGARSMALQDGHTGEPIKVAVSSGGYALTYPRRSRLAALWIARIGLARQRLEGIAHRRACDQQSAILRAIR